MDINSSLDNKQPHTHAPNSKGVNQREGFWATNAGFDLIVTLELHFVIRVHRFLTPLLKYPALIFIQ